LHKFTLLRKCCSKEVLWYLILLGSCDGSRTLSFFAALASHHCFMCKGFQILVKSLANTG